MCIGTGTGESRGESLHTNKPAAFQLRGGAVAIWHTHTRTRTHTHTHTQRKRERFGHMSVKVGEELAGMKGLVGTRGADPPRLRSLPESVQTQDGHHRAGGEALL